MEYKIINDLWSNKAISVTRINSYGNIICIPFSPDNTDYQTFKREVAAGTPLEDPDGNIMSQEQIDAFLATIP